MTTAKLLALSLFAAASVAATAVLAEPVAEGGRKFTTPMSGAEECNSGGCNVGDPDGTATGHITVNVGQNRVCWEFTNVTNIAAPHRSHIHKAAAGTNGGIVVDFFNMPVGTPGPLSGCTTAVLSRELLIDIIQHPSDYYLNLHNEPFPAGAIRGQLEKN
jgi:hypothetical protein